MSLNNEEEVIIPITVQEEKELRRVFDHLCDFQKKVKINKEILEIKQVLVMNRIKANRVPDADADDLDATRQTNMDYEARMEVLNKELNAAETSNPQKKIYIADVMEKLKELNQKVSKKEVEEMIWEVDEDLDQALDWPEFKLMFTRNIADKSGLEPSRMYNLTQFLIYDHNNSGLVSVDKTMNMLYARFGRFRMEGKLKELFGDDMHETGREGGEITFSKYVQAVERIQIQTFWNTTKGKMIARNGSKKI